MDRELPNSSQKARDLLEKPHEAIALLCSMIDGGENHTKVSDAVIIEAKQNLQLVAWFLEKQAYNRLPAINKPKCKARLMKARGKVSQCNRSCEWNSMYCYSHREWGEDDEMPF